MKLKQWKLIALGSAFSLATAIGQAPPEPDPGTIQSLSPFVVEGREDVGYRATSTLAGTRIKSDLRDLGASISVVTEQFLEDTNSVNLADVLIYTPNTEVAGLAGNFSGSQGFGAGNPIPELHRDNQQGGVTRVRGLARADLTRDYFLTDVPFDAFNTNRVEVQRGANSALFGLGSPGGVVNNNLVRADFLRDRGRVRFETDEYGSSRFSFRTNHVLAEDTFSFFAAGLHDEEEFEQRQAFKKDQRIYFSALYQPFENTRIHASVEWGDRIESRPDFTPPNDAITPWFLLGRPTVDNASDGAALFRGNGDFVPGVGNNLFFNVFPTGSNSGGNAFFLDPNNPDPTFSGTGFVRAGRGLNNHFATDELMLLVPRSMGEITRLSGLRPDGTMLPPGFNSFFVTGNQNLQITDRSIFDYRENAFHGGSSQQESRWRVLNASIDRTWLDDAFGLELAYYKQVWREEAFNALQGAQERSISVDMNRYLIGTTDGTPNGPPIPNPNFGGLVMGGLSGGNNRDHDREEIRITGFGEIIASDFLGDNLASKILGRLKVTAVAQQRERQSRTLFARDKLNPNSVANAIGGGNLSALSVVESRTGLVHALPFNGTSLLNLNSVSDLSGLNIQPVPHGLSRNRPPRNQTFTMWDLASESFVNFDSTTSTLKDNNGDPAAFFGSRVGEEIDSTVVVAQHYLWDDHIVLQGSWREDKQRSATIRAPGKAPQSVDLFDPTFLAGPPLNLPLDAKEQTRSWSIVLHSPDIINQYLPWGTRLSVHKSKADNFQPSPSRRDSLNRPIDPITGATEEYGFTLSTLEGKLVLKWNWYETGILNNSFQAGGIATPESIMVNLARQLANPDNIAQGFTAADAQAVLPPQAVIDLHGVEFDFANAQANSTPNPSRVGTQDFTSKGQEIELSYNPVPNWNILLNIGKQETITANTYPVLGQLFNDVFEPLWINSNFAQNFFIDDLSTQTLAQRTIEQIRNPLLRGRSQDGRPSIEQRRYRFNLNTSYRFTDEATFIPGWLGSLTVGGSARWEDKAGVGFALATNDLGELGPDRSQPFFGSELWFFDAFARAEYDLGRERQLSVQLNVKDIFDNDQLIPVFANPDNSRTFRFLEGRKVSASVTYAW